MILVTLCFICITFIIVLQIPFSQTKKNNLKLNSTETHLFHEGKPFLNKYHEINHFHSIQEKIHCMSLNGSWEYDSSIQYSTISCQHKALLARGICNNNTLNNISYKYYWKVDDNKCDFGELQKLSTKNMCSMMNGKSILIVGDSLSQAFFIELVEVLSKAFSSTKCVDLLKQVNKYQKLAIIPCALLNPRFRDLFVINVRNDFLSLTDTYSWNSSESTVEGDWKQFLDTNLSYNVSLIIMNRGAHYREDDNLISMTTKAINFITSKNPNVTIIWRNTIIGIENPESHFNDKPLLQVPNISLQFNWNRLPLQNNLIHSLIKEKKYDWNVIYWDVFYSSALRLDYHHDYIHFCRPGVYDTWVKMFYNILNMFYE